MAPLMPAVIQWTKTRPSRATRETIHPMDSIRTPKTLCIMNNNPTLLIAIHPKNSHNSLVRELYNSAKKTENFKDGVCLNCALNVKNSKWRPPNAPACNNVQPLHTLPRHPHTVTARWVFLIEIWLVYWERPCPRRLHKPLPEIGAEKPNNPTPKIRAQNKSKNLITAQQNKEKPVRFVNQHGLFWGKLNHI